MREDSRTDEAKPKRARQTKLVLTCDVTQMDAAALSDWSVLLHSIAVEYARGRCWCWKDCVDSAMLSTTSSRLMVVSLSYIRIVF